jgi:HPr kinase/phosphorylase
VSRQESKSKSLTVQQFLEFGAKRLKMRMVAGAEGLRKLISSGRVQKTGLALADFTECITRERVQMLGRTEMHYLAQLPSDQRKEMLENLLSCDLACLIITTGEAAPPYLIEAADKHQTPLFTSPLESTEAIDLITHYLDLQLAPSTSLHGALLDIFGLGVLLIGDSGVGKSECALELIARGHRLVADDVVEIMLVENEVLIGTCPQALRYLMELRGIGLIDIKDLFGVGSVRDSKKIELVIKLERWKDDVQYSRLGVKERRYGIFGIDLPYVIMPVAPGRNLGILVELAARNQLLKLRGVHVARRVSRKLDSRLKQAAPADEKKIKSEKKGAGLFE